MSTNGDIVLVHLSTALTLIGLVVFLVSSVWLSIVDVQTMRLPNRLVAWSLVGCLGPLVAANVVLLPTALRGDALADLAALLLGAVVLGAVFAALWRFAPAGLGGGDVKIAPVVGGVLGLLGGVWAVAAGIVIACVFAVIWNAVLGHRSGDGSPVGAPFAPCLFAAAWVVCIAWLGLALDTRFAA